MLRGEGRGKEGVAEGGGPRGEGLGVLCVGQWTPEGVIPIESCTSTC